MNVLVAAGSRSSLAFARHSSAPCRTRTTVRACTSRRQWRSSPQVISTKVNGGVVGGLLAFRNEVLDGARRDLGQVAVGLGAAFNAQHRQGMDLQGNLGGDFFTSTVPLSSGAVTNTGTAVLVATIVDADDVVSRDYELRFNGSAWSVIDRASGVVVPATGAGTPASPLLFDGLSIAATGAPAAGDRSWSGQWPMPPRISAFLSPHPHRSRRPRRWYRVSGVEHVAGLHCRAGRHGYH